MVAVARMMMYSDSELALLFRSCPYVVTLLAPLESWIHFKWWLFTTDGSILSQNTKVQGYLNRIS